ncbi:MAG: hypothetical protein BGO49_06215 [Planctomycetales bacterium 71-10]|nr:MAG: hypothetical protein BGO49_06215 [Planctomycetales bacterium 71-10]
MERPNVLRPRLAPLGAMLALAVAASSGCRSTKSEVPPGRPYARTGEPPVVGFSSDPHPAPGNAAGGIDYNVGPGASGDDKVARAKAASTFGTPTAGEKVARPTTNAYGPPGTSGVDPTAGATPADLANELMNSQESTAKSLTRDLEVNPPSEQP